MHNPLRLKFALIVWPIMLTSPAFAEYRAFELVISNQTGGQGRVVVTTLDDIQYAGYHHVRKDETVAIQDTWMCWRRSDGPAAICPNPKKAAPNSKPL